MIEILFSLMYTKMVLMVEIWGYRMPFDAHGCVFTLMNITFYAKILIERGESIDGVDSLK